MKKGVGVFAAALLLTALVPRPAAAGATFDWGIKGGISLAKVNWIDEGEEDPSDTLLQPVFGAFVAINFSKAFAFQPEVYLLTRGGEWTEEYETVVKWVEKWQFIHVPLLAKVNLKQGGKTIPVLFAGPAVNFNLSAKGKIYEDGELVDEYDFKDYVKATTLSLVFGGGVEKTMEKFVLILDIRYDIGLTNPITFIDEEVKFGTFMFMAGIKF
jgi:hypothetical protein